MSKHVETSTLMAQSFSSHLFLLNQFTPLSTLFHPLLSFMPPALAYLRQPAQKGCASERSRFHTGRVHFMPECILWLSYSSQPQQNMSSTSGAAH